MATVKPVIEEHDDKQSSKSFVKGKKPFKGKGSSKSSSKSGSIDKRSSWNDPNWYVLHPELLRDVASLAFNHAVGAPIVGTKFQYMEFPFLAVIPCLLTPGVSTSGTSAINIASRSVYTFVRHANSGHSNYEMADLGMYLLATSSVVVALLLAERALGLAKAYVFKNRTMSENVLQSLFSVGYTDLIKNNADYTAKLNILWAKLGSLCIPKDFKFLDRWTWMCSHVFKDHESSKAGLYAFDFPYGLKFDATSMTTGGCLFDYEYDRTDMGTYLDDVETCLDAILTDEDMNIISGDILKAYGQENLVKFAFTPYDYILYPEYVEEMLPQIQNLATVPFYTSMTNDGIAPYIGKITGADTTFVRGHNQVIYQANNEILCGYGFAVAGLTPADWDFTSGYPQFDGSTASAVIPQSKDRPGIFINSYKETPEPGDVMVATRLHPIWTNMPGSTSTKGILYISECGTEIPLYVMVSLIGSNANKSYFQLYTEAGFLSSNTNGIKSNLLGIAKASQLDWLPIAYHSEANNGSSYYTGMATRHVFGDLDNYTPLADSDLAAMHNAAVLAEFTTPIMNIFNPK